MSIADSTNHRVQKFALGVPGWRQVNINGFGDRRSQIVDSLEVFNGHLYAGTGNWGDGTAGAVWRTSDGTAWSRVSDVGFGSPTTNRAMMDMTVFKNRLYVSTGWGDGRGQLWRTADGVNWGQVEGDGFGTDSIAIVALAAWNDALYACTDNNATGTDLWRSSTGNPGTWSRVVSGGNGNPQNHICTGFQAFNGHLYTSVENRYAGVQVWRSANGASWEAVATGGFGDAANRESGGLAVFNDALYVGTSNETVGGQLWRSQDGITWTPAGAPGMGDANNHKADGLIVFQGQLYVFETNTVTGIEAWRSPDGTHWTQISPDGFGDSSNNFTLWSNGLAVFGNRLYAGTEAIEGSGGKIWRYASSQTYLPLVLR